MSDLETSEDSAIAPTPLTAPAAPTPPAPVAYSMIRQRASHDWATALIVACLALGLLLGWGNYEFRQRRMAQDDVRSYRHDLDSLVSRDSDLGSLLADPETKFIRLETVDGRERETLHQVAIAWNQGRQRGVLFCDNLSPAGQGKVYQLWLIPQEGSGSAMAVGLADPEPGRTVYAFSPMDRAEPHQFVLTVGRPAALPGQADAQLAHASLD